MPEQLTKYPDVTLQVLRSGGARCGEGAPQEILKTCPAARFCKLPGGEVCVYGLSEADQMTQISTLELGALARPAQPLDGASSTATGVTILITAFLALAIGATGSWLFFRRAARASGEPRS